MNRATRRSISLREVMSVATATAVAVSCVVFAVGFTGRPAPAAQSDTEATTEIVRQDPAWAFNCERAADGSEHSCQISQYVSVRETGQRIVSVVVQRDADTATVHMLLALPHKIHLPSGVGLSVDEGTQALFEIETCDERACYATMVINDTFVGHMASGATLAVTFKNLMQKPVTVPVPLGGFEPAFELLPR